MVKGNLLKISMQMIGTYRMVDLFIIFSITLVVISSILIFGILWIGYNDQMIPDQWGEHVGNHGPWRHYYAVRGILQIAILIPMYLQVATLNLLLFKPCWRTLYLFVAGMAYLIFIMHRFYWLID
jgi:hypothetical protein